MADEAVNGVLSGKIDYTLKYYLKYLEEIKSKAKLLSSDVAASKYNDSCNFLY